MATVKSFAEDFVRFLNKAVTPYHAVKELRDVLTSAGFKELKETESWKDIIAPLGKYFVTRNESNIFAFAVGGKFEPGNGISMISAHTDSPCFKVKPVSKLASGHTIQLGIGTYGGGLWRTWFDRDLTAAGILMIKNGEGISHKLVNVERPIMSIPNLAIHLDTEREKFVFNKEEHLRPILASQIEHALHESKSDDSGEHHSAFLRLLANTAGVDVEKVINFDLNIIDTQPAALTGLYEEFVSGGRLDNLVGTFTTIQGLLESLKDQDSLAQDPNIRLVGCFDDEECGSQSAQGAASSLTEWILRRLQGGGSGNAFEESIPKSYHISADQAHALHPNYKSKHDENHGISFSKGVVVKINFNQRYATTPRTHAILQLIAEKAGVPLQKFVIRNDSLCGSTVGPILSAKLGLQTIDVGTTQLAMHSVREIADTAGIFHAKELYKEFFKTLPTIMRNTI